MTSIDGAEFRALFVQEAEQRLTRMGQELLELEEAGSGDELVASLFRDAHTLKGAAAVVGFDAIGRVSHAMEDVLEHLRSGQRHPTPALIDALLATVDGLAAMVAAAMGGGEALDGGEALERRLRAILDEAPATDHGDGADGAARDIDAVADEAGSKAGRSAPRTSDGDPSPLRPRHETETLLVPVERLDELVRLVGESAAAHRRVGRLLSERLSADPTSLGEYRALSRVLNELQQRTMHARMVPIATITDSLHRAVRDLARSLGKQVRFEVDGAETEMDRSLLQQLADPLLHLVRNAVDHGIELPSERAEAGKPETAMVSLQAKQVGSEVLITIRDDGRGIDIERVRQQAVLRGDEPGSVADDDSIYLIFRSGLSTARFVSDVSGRGVGLDVVRAGVHAARGRIEVATELGEGSEFRIVVPITLAVLPCLVVEAGGDRFAIPLHSVVIAQDLSATEQAHAEGRPAVWVGPDSIPVSALTDTLGLPADEVSETGHILVLAGGVRRHAFKVDLLVDQRDVVIKGLGPLLPNLEVIAGASVEPDGAILLVLDAVGLIERARAVRTRRTPPGGSEEAPVVRRSVLVVDDALTVRELERSILQRAGYDVRTAADGVEALALLADAPSDLVLTDLDMPRLDGFGLTEAIRAHESLANIPVLMVTSRASEADRQRGLEVGADGYIVKSAFDEAGLVGAVERLLGRDA